jgi:hypothetical protein
MGKHAADMAVANLVFFVVVFDFNQLHCLIPTIQDLISITIGRTTPTSFIPRSRVLIVVLGPPMVGGAGGRATVLLNGKHK